MNTNTEAICNILNNVKGAIFDLDGTLIDSMGMWDDIDREYLKKKNLPFPLNLKTEIEHLNFEETADYFKTKFNIEDSLDVIEKDWYDMAYYKYSRNIMVKPYVKNFLELLKLKNIKIALATSNYREISEIALKKNNIYDLFDIITVTQDVSRGKDFPDLYLLASKKINVIPEKCVVFEDSLPAIKSAKSANMSVIAIKDPYCPHPFDELLTYADAGIVSFHQLIDKL
ncbi:HAD superfamily hydrolase (TIGR01509 family) [Clostridium algifaecis]|uniref:HAD superfamily hydrolase (TIGR01509 family) n=1 Tax=Clostridium algifaecis TaxID=1472040 RepID=A0ABS4KV80_9CLOT|nr:HAD family phosphatase [Clostridium algifaecis]MBP2033949.1 HAD superfamily hydrolase (TIGR01509 family) [Clostridium algifaecis]